MQSLTGGPRSGLSADVVERIIRRGGLTVRGGLDLLDGTDAFVSDISGDLVSGSVEHQCDAPITGVVRLSISRELRWGVDRVRPYAVLSSDAVPGVEARVELGVYVLTTPIRNAGDDVPTFQVEGYDKAYLLDREIGDTYSVASGTPVLQAVRDALTAAGETRTPLLGSDADAETLPTAMVWPLLDARTRWINVIDDLLRSVSYERLWYDEVGRSRANRKQLFTVRAPEWTFDAASPLTMVSENVAAELDTWSVPNRWILVAQNGPGTPTPGNGVYIFNNVSDGLTSQDLIGVRAQTFRVDASSQATLVAQADEIVEKSKTRSAVYRLSVSPFPLGGHNDVYGFTDSRVSASGKVRSVSWVFDLTGNDTIVEWEGIP